MIAVLPDVLYSVSGCKAELAMRNEQFQPPVAIQVGYCRARS